MKFNVFKEYRVIVSQLVDAATPQEAIDRVDGIHHPDSVTLVNASAESMDEPPSQSPSQESQGLASGWSVTQLEPLADADTVAGA